LAELNEAQGWTRVGSIRGWGRVKF